MCLSFFFNLNRNTEHDMIVKYHFVEKKMKVLEKLQLSFQVLVFEVSIPGFLTSVETLTSCSI